MKKLNDLARKLIVFFLLLTLVAVTLYDHQYDATVLIAGPLCRLINSIFFMVDPTSRRRLDIFLEGESSMFAALQYLFFIERPASRHVRLVNQLVTLSSVVIAAFLFKSQIGIETRYPYLIILSLIVLIATAPLHTFVRLTVR